MLLELSVRNLGVIEALSLLVPPGMTALTGETGAGKTLIVEAIDLLLGGRADAVLVRPGADEAWVEGRFEVAGEELILARAVPAGGGRSRAYVNGRMASIATLAEAGEQLVDLHGQHAHQSLLGMPLQRAALDQFGGVDVVALADSRRALAAVEAELATLGGDGRARAREIDLLRFQLSEIGAANIEDDGEEERLEAEEDLLAEATAHREAALAAYAALRDEAGALDLVARAGSYVSGRSPFEQLATRLAGLEAEIADAGEELRGAIEAIVEDPERLAEVRSRRHLLRELRRKYGDTLDDVLTFVAGAEARLDELLSYESRAAQLERQRAEAERAVVEQEAKVAAARRGAAPELASAIEARVRRLALPNARVAVQVGEQDPGDDVTFLFAANKGERLLPLAKVASGGELARLMLAAQLVLSDAPPTLVFDEVDAGIGGEAARAVGRDLAELAAGRQVLVVTHLPQVAAYADHQVRVTKSESGGRTIASAHVVGGVERVVELSRMLSGQPDSATARQHAEELLATAATERRG